MLFSDEEGPPKHVYAHVCEFAAQCGEMTNHLGLGEIKTALGDNGIERGHRHGHTLVFTRAGTHARTQTQAIHLASLSLHTYRFLIRTQVHTHPSLSPAPACWSPWRLAVIGRHGTSLWAPLWL